MQEKMTKLVDAGHAVSRLVPAHAFVDMLIERNDWPYGICNRLSTAKHAGVLDPNLVVGNQLRNDEFKDDAIDALAALGEPSIEKLIETLRDKDENVRKRAVRALGKIKGNGAIDPLIAMVGDKDWETRLLAAAALESIGDERGRDAIKPLLKDPDMVVKMRVERILAKWKKQPISQPANA